MTCYHLIESGDIDAVVVNYVGNPRALNGNYWWASSKFLAQLPTIPYDYYQNYTASEWLFSSPIVKIFKAHSSNVNHNFAEYPRFCYASVAPEMTPTFEDFKRVCNKRSLEAYVSIHNASALLGPDFPAYSETFHNLKSDREVTASCSTLELSIVFD